MPFSLLSQYIKQYAIIKAMVRLIASLIVSTVVVAVVYYFNPWGVKEKTAETISELDFLPESVRNKAEEILLTPPQRREKIIQQLEDSLDDVKTFIKDQAQNSPPEVKAAIAKSEKLIAQLKDANIEPGILNTTATKIAEGIKTSVTSSDANQNCNN